tara:strand:- start:1535 stop:3250 length:1716 start_codon:yes stop_codon:yes gene_type:complete
MEINYKKNKNLELFKQLSDEKLVNIDDIQNYIPIYSKFFNLNENNYNSINLNNYYNLNSIDDKIGYSKFDGTIIDSSNNISKKKIFFKYSPLVDPIKYMLGKYDLSYDIYELPKIKNSSKIIKKSLDNNNSAYTDGFFSFLSSLLLNKYDFLNGIDYYGSFLGNKNNFIVDVEDDVDYLDDSEFFHKNNNILFKIEENEHSKNFFSNTKKNRKELCIEEENISDDLLNICEISELNNNEYNLSEINLSDKLEIEYNNNNENNENIENNVQRKKIKTNEHNESESSCSSRYSNTNSSESNCSENSDESEETDESEESTEAELLANIFKLPIQTIALECCEDTLDSYIINNKIKDDEWESIVLQIIFTLITYQKVFDFTHNDLHTNNIVYNNTDKKFLYYKFNNKHYKVPTFGKIYKIIDFGRAIYKFKGKIICSDSYAPEGDAHTQYNTEPYLNEEKPRLDPNYSFDLCRLGCSLFDYFIEDIEDIKKLKSPIKKIMIEWVFDDSNKNILYKNDGSERYPDFKLYKMIARTVHNHKPQHVINKSLFDKYTLPKKKIKNQSAIFNIDILPNMC